MEQEPSGLRALYMRYFGMLVRTTERSLEKARNYRTSLRRAVKLGEIEILGKRCSTKKLGWRGMKFGGNVEQQVYSIV